MTAAAEIQALIDERVTAVRAKDVDRSMARYAPDLVLFDVINPLQCLGTDTVRRRAAEWFSSFQGPLGYEMRDVTISAGEDVAFSHGLNHVSATKMDGKKLDMWWRATVCYRKIDGAWKVTDEHNSVPFNVESGKAALALKP
jgi:uncharacterized protein (TIGR02246 family)